MDDNALIAIFSVLLYVVPLVLVGIGALIYDRWKKRTRLGENYRCPTCGFVIQQKDVVLSGWESHPYGLHINCPNCGRKVEQFVKKINDWTFLQVTVGELS